MKTNLPSFSSYGNCSSDNYGVNTLVFTDSNGVSFYYSYKTLVAFETRIGELFVRENEWGCTTGKHLNWIDGGDKKNRLTAEQFNARLGEYLGV